MKTIIHIVPSLGYGGAEVLLAKLVKQTSDFSVKHVVLALSCAENKVLMPNGENIFEFHFTRNPFKTLFSIWRITKSEVNFTLLGWLYIGSFVACLLALIRRCACVCYIHHSLTNIDVERRHTRYLIRILSWVSRSWVVKKIIYVSSLSQRHHEAIGYAADKSLLIYNGIDTNVFMPDDVRRHEGEDRIVIGNFGRFHPVKDHNLLFQLVVQLVSRGYEVELHLAGEHMTSQNEALTKLLQQYHLTENAVLHGTVADISQLYKLLDVYILSSKAESFPNVILEAMCYGLLIVSTDVGDVKKLLDADFVELERDNLNGVADKILERIKTQDNNARYKRFQKRLTSDFEQEKQFQKLLRAIHG